MSTVSQLAFEGESLPADSSDCSASQALSCHVNAAAMSSAAQFTEYVAGTPAGHGKNLVPLSQLRAEGLLEAVQSGIFTWAQHDRFCQMIRVLIR